MEERDLKNDSNKLRYDLFPVDALEAITEVLNFGARKYESRAWEKGMQWSRLYAALLRHMFAWWIGEPTDKESGLSHLAHAGCCLVFLLAYERREMRVFDDRPISRLCECAMDQKISNKEAA